MLRLCGTHSGQRAVGVFQTLVSLIWRGLGKGGACEGGNYFGGKRNFRKGSTRAAQEDSSCSPPTAWK
jgi:hypothetical protein